MHHDDYTGVVRTTVSLDDDVAAEVERLRRERGLGLSEALNELARVGVGVKRRRTQPAFRQQTSNLGLLIDVDNVAEVLDVLDAP